MESTVLRCYIWPWFYIIFFLSSLIFVWHWMITNYSPFFEELNQIFLLVYLGICSAHIFEWRISYFCYHGSFVICKNGTASQSGNCTKFVPAGRVEIIVNFVWHRPMCPNIITLPLVSNKWGIVCLLRCLLEYSLTFSKKTKSTRLLWQSRWFYCICHTTCTFFSRGKHHMHIGANKS
jgi:hypothetical protein